MVQASGNSSRVAIVTGGSRGIGRQCAERLGAEGYAVAVLFGGNQSEADDTVQAINGRGAQALAVKADVADETAVANAFTQVEEAFGGVDVLVHAAGIMKLSPLAELDLVDFDHLHRVNVRGTFVVDQQAIRRLRTGGAIINFSSSVVGLAPPTYSAYSATKGAVEAITLILARELRGRDVTVNAIAPGPTATALFLDGKDDETIQRLAAQAPLERLGVPDDIAEVVALLAGSGRWINGQVIRVNGGII
ncbi:SDR family oxidoreductase [Mycobacteroides abscessus]|uniref:SDR family oxidoreductase n=1 Tax=Mycobacteroides abscessus TaxID=36809 RepID=UPI0009A6DBB6|nr:SDR family oxidoreductase [Mycobacteroides abscessus]RIT40856.1 SDR family oxidoreductase [Mycobacteroides abscessus]SKT94425.1 short-chain dehydrogenase/reductase [Mycobacteroides abscessus subsp. massiliense]SKU20375.1 short-chain dehydrogenase/reductase [Mycobacteroides abscessus subsp. massiliense]